MGARYKLDLACLRVLIFIATLRSSDALAADKLQDDFRREAQANWDHFLCKESKDTQKKNAIERHSQPTHGDVCRGDAGEFSCPLMDKGQSNWQKCTRTALGKAPYCEMREGLGGPLLPCRAAKLSKEWLAEETEKHAAEAARKQAKSEISEKRWTTCVGKRGFTKGGQWVSSKTTIPGAGCESNSSWIWQPASALCRLAPLSADALCKAAMRAYVKHIVLIGDSLTRLWTAEMTGLLKQTRHCALNVSYVSSKQMVADEVAIIEATLKQMNPDAIVVNWGVSTFRAELF